MTKAIRSFRSYEVTEIALRRARENSGGLGMLAAKDYLKKHRLEASAAEPAASALSIRRDFNIERVAKARRDMIEMGIIKPATEALCGECGEPLGGMSSCKYCKEEE